MKKEKLVASLFLATSISGCTWFASTNNEIITQPQPKDKVMTYTYQIDGLPVETGDIICTSDGGGPFIDGQLWRLIGMLIPGEVDHIAIYIGPNGRCVEAGAKLHVVAFGRAG